MIDGIKNIKYLIGWRIYPEYFKNLEDPDDNPENHLSLWSNDKNIHNDSMNEKFYGDKVSHDETICFYSKRIQKFNTFSKLQQKNLDYFIINNSAEDEGDSAIELKSMTNNLVYDTEIIVDKLYKYEKNGEKNIIIGKNKKFSYLFAILLKKIEAENGFEKMIEILQDKPKFEEIYTILFILYHCFDYIHIDYFKEKLPLLKNSILAFINSDLDDNEMKDLPKDFDSTLTDLFEKINENEIEVSLFLYLKKIKNSSFNIRLNGLKSLNDLINKKINNKVIKAKIVELINKSNIIKTIFSSNYNSEIINQTTEVIKYILYENQLNINDFNIILNCSEIEDQETKIAIFHLLSEISALLNEKHVEILLNNIISTDITKLEIEKLNLIPKLSLKTESNQKIMLNLIEKLLNYVFSSSQYNEKDISIIENIPISYLKQIFFEKIFVICLNNLKKNENSIKSINILTELIQIICLLNKSIYEKLIKDNNLIQIIETNFRLYKQEANEIMEKNNIEFNKKRDDYLIKGYTHLENVNRRLDLLNLAIIYLYKDYDYLPLLNEILVNKPLSPNDSLRLNEFTNSI